MPCNVSIFSADLTSAEEHVIFAVVGTENFPIKRREILVCLFVCDKRRQRPSGVIIRANSTVRHVIINHRIDTIRYDRRVMEVF